MPMIRLSLVRNFEAVISCAVRHNKILLSGSQSENASLKLACYDGWAADSLSKLISDRFPKMNFWNNCYLM